MMSPVRRSRGYTLIEVLVAFMIMAMALTVLMRIFSGGLRNIGVSSEYAEAVLVAESRLAAAAYDGSLVPGESQGVYGDRYRWTQRVAEFVPYPGYTTSARGITAYEVDVTVEWPNGDRTRSIDLGTIRLVQTDGAAR